MADWITVQGLRPYDGRYELDLNGAPLTVREWGWMKRHTGYLPVNLDGDTFTDPEVITILAVIAMRRAGTISNDQVGEIWDRFADAPFGSAITFQADTNTEEDDAGPPPANSNGNETSSGDGSPTSSERSGWPTLVSSGTPASATSASTPTGSVTSPR